ncbi:caffeoylshikimate esterase-like [Andrographis paniculata]|uniref:caffeoylshikimate esterase-like n=1 Tax=Andrographis paniculata TaxID=175694 RepID=UPI0021E7060F|nr:caffeoylshikimate esterase-like [Andrographis paniculata]
MHGTWCAVRLARAGYEVYGVDCEGHGKSSGMLGLIPNFDNLVDDLFNCFTAISKKKENERKMRFVMGESMGGAMALRLHLKDPDFWDGAVLVAPMCKIAEEMKPSPLVIKALTSLARLAPTWKLTPSPDIVDSAFRDPRVRQQIRSNPYTYKGRPRLQTSHELYKACLDLEKRLREVSLPFIVLHGEDDKVTDPAVSRVLYETARATDKTWKLYPGMWHSLSYGELPENLDIVFSDIIQWLDDRASASAAKFEEQLKIDNDHNANAPKKMI